MPEHTTKIELPDGKLARAVRVKTLTDANKELRSVVILVVTDPENPNFMGMIAAHEAEDEHLMIVPVETDLAMFMTNIYMNQSNPGAEA